MIFPYCSVTLAYEGRAASLAIRAVALKLRDSSSNDLCSSSRSSACALTSSRARSSLVLAVKCGDCEHSVTSSMSFSMRASSQLKLGEWLSTRARTNTHARVVALKDPALKAASPRASGPPPDKSPSGPSGVSSALLGRTLLADRLPAELSRGCGFV